MRERTERAMPLGLNAAAGAAAAAMATKTKETFIGCGGGETEE